MKKMLSVMLMLALCLSTSAALAMTPGTYTAEMNGMNGPVKVEVTVSQTAIESVTVPEHTETLGIGASAIDMLIADILDNQTPNVDSVAGATVTSAVVKSAVKTALKEAGAEADILDKQLEKAAPADAEYTADVVVVGAGGAGLAAAVRALEQGASVIMIEKTAQVGGNSLVAGGFINAPDPSRQDYKYQSARSASLETLITDAIDEEPVSDAHKALQDAVRADYEEYLASDKTLFDSANWFALQTWNGGDKLGNLDAVIKLTAGAQDALLWLEELGQEFEEDVHLGGGALYPRSHQAILPNGLGYIKALSGALEGKENLTQLFCVTAESLITDGDKVVGVNAVAKDGSRITLHANNGVVLATGGFAGNVELRQKYCEGEKWPDLGPNVRTTNVSGVTGDGIFMAAEVGANLVNMDQIQLLPYCNPATGFLNDSYSAKVSIFINKEGNRFVREDGRRDDMSKAIIAQTDSVMYYFKRLDGKLEEEKSLAGQPLTYLIEAGVSNYCYGKTIEEIAEKMGVPADALQAAVSDFDAHVDSQTADEFGRVSFPEKFGDGPFVAFTRSPAAHHTMGGVEIDTDAHALRADGSIIEGLYCAGEITGVVHGTNRVGGNAIVDFMVYGQIAGMNAAKGE